MSVLTTPRRPKYFPGTIASIDSAGARQFPGRKVVFVDGPAAPAMTIDGWEIESLTDGYPSRGTRRSMFEILHRAAVGGAHELLYFEDDVRICRNGIYAMRAFRVAKELGFLSFFQMQAGPTWRGVHRFEQPAFWGSQALKFPARSLAMFAGGDLNPHTEDLYSGDVWIGKLLTPGIVVPTIVRHIGADSSIDVTRGITGHQIHRAGLNYAGDDFDALRILWASP